MIKLVPLQKQLRSITQVEGSPLGLNSRKPNLIVTIKDSFFLVLQTIYYILNIITYKIDKHLYKNYTISLNIQLISGNACT